MSRFIAPTCFVILLFTTIATGWVHGSLSNRWGMRATAQLAADRLKPDLPVECGSWKMSQPLEIPADACRVLQNPTYVSRIYVHQQTGDEVSMFVLAGHPGPISVHSPEICYSSQDYTIDGARRKTKIKSASGESHEFWELALKPRNPMRGSDQQVLYAWSTGTVWEAAEHPRFGYGGLPHLYKLQIALSKRPGSQAKGFKPAEDFLESFLNQVQPRLVEASRRSNSSR